MSTVIRKISIGSDYKNDAMHYAVGQQVYGGHEISHILFEDKDASYNIFIKKNNEVLPWKKFIFEPIVPFFKIRNSLSKLLVV